MARLITLTEEAIAKFLSSVESQARSGRFSGKVSLTMDIAKDDRTAALVFTPWAWSKMLSLVTAYSTEVEWHGLVRRNAEDVFEVYDILIFPHEVTGATVTSDEAKYAEWLNTLDDYTFNSMRFHGHSHVEMGVTPSSVDKEYRAKKVRELPSPKTGEDAFYAFLIINKRLDVEAQIFDLTNNAMYSTTDGSLAAGCLSDDGDSLDDFVDEAKSVVTTRPVTPATYGSGSYNYGSCGSYQYGNTTTKTKGKKEKVAKTAYDLFDDDDDYYGWSR